MKIELEIEALEALELCKLHKSCMEMVEKHMGSYPFLYSKWAVITNSFLNEVVKKIPPDEIDRINKERREAQ